MVDSLLLKYKLKLQNYGLSNCSSHHISSYPRNLGFRGVINYELRLKKSIFSSQSIYCSRLKPVSAISSDRAHSISREPLQAKHKNFEEWDSLTARFAGAANLPFFLLQLPQIILNFRNLLAGNRSALLALPWLGMLTGLLGNLSLLSYFIKKRETEAVVVQMLGVISMYAVVLQLAMAEAMPLPHFVITSVVTASGVILNLMKYFDFLNTGIWKSWEDFITILGLSTLPQVMWSTFVPIVPNTVLPGFVALLTAVLVVSMARMGKLSEKGINILGSVSAWTATLLLMWMPVAQMWTILLNPENVKGLSSVTMLLAMIGNGLLIPRALLTRDLMWFTGSTWSCVFYGWGNLVCLYRNHFLERCTSPWTYLILDFFKGAHFRTLIFHTFWKDAQVHGHTSYLTSLEADDVWTEERGCMQKNTCSLKC